MYGVMGDNLCGNLISYLIDSVRAYIRKYTRNNDVNYIVDNLFVGSERHDKRLYNIRIDLRNIPEGGIPTKKEVEDIIHLIKNVYPQMVLLYCRMGRSRSAIIAILYLAKEIELKYAIDLVKSRRKYIHLNKKQMNFLRRYKK